MEAYILDWLQLLLRSLHVVTGIAWIGASFYFVWLDNHLRKPEDKELKEKGVDGELWAVHGGGFYNPQKYMVAPAALPKDLHWFYWESYSTWMSGFGLFVVVYLLNPKTLLIDPKVMALSSGVAVSLALAFLAVGWVIYDGLCRVFAGRDRLVGALVAIMVAATAYAAFHVFSGRAAYLITGAMMATIMTANVFHVIIPGQRKVIAAMREGLPVDPIHGRRGKQRSVHNTYFTLPVLFAMLSNHFHLMTNHAHGWVVLLLMMAAGVVVRQFFVLRHKGKSEWSLIAVALILMSIVFWWLAPAPRSDAQALSSVPHGIADVEAIVNLRCIQCHADHPTMVEVAPKNISFSRREGIEANASAIYLQVVQQKNMPLGNVTGITDDERRVFQAWFEEK